jgi:ppGpp synthetase/RelA/SpoT-type nucleotidyltranferase
VTRSQIDKLGEELRAGRRDEEVLGKLEGLYSYYEPAARSVSEKVRAVLGLRRVDDSAYTERSTKTLDSIVSKLSRERTRLSTMQDIVGCRIIVSGLTDQESLKHSLVRAEDVRILERLWWGDLAALGRVPPFSKFAVTDRSESPKNGYRALHLVIRDFEVPYEIQIRTRLQDRWAQISELLNDRFQGFKYGGGPSHLRDALQDLSARTFDAETRYFAISEEVIAESQRDDLTEDTAFQVVDLFDKQELLGEELAEVEAAYDEFEAAIKNRYS